MLLSLYVVEIYATVNPHIKANVLLKRNIDALLKGRNLRRKDLALWCRRSQGWLSQLFTSDERNIPLKYLDRMADFFGLATYQLFAPGISALTERRSNRDRRSGQDRRVSKSQDTLRPPHTPDTETVTAWERSLLRDLRVMSAEGRRHVLHAIDLARGAPSSEPNTTTRRSRRQGAEPESESLPRVGKRRR